MEKNILIIILILSLFVGFGTIITYYSQDYTYTLNIKEEILTSEVYVTLTNGMTFNRGSNSVFGIPLTEGNWTFNESDRTIQSASLILGNMNFKNEGIFSRVVEVPRFVTCINFNATSIDLSKNSILNPRLFWPEYTINKPTISEPYANIGSMIVYDDGVNGGYNVRETVYGYGPSLSLKPGKEITYYISLKNAMPAIAKSRNSDVFKNVKIEVYELPTKKFNPISPGVTYDSLAYNPTCNLLAQEFNPVETIEII
ncbi:hypothetical protein EXS72_01505 [Candidatus Pacearchaeota archaeon]|nr:hypothetical protein [Candidatus Pacearchaeota archaeon]